MLQTKPKTQIKQIIWDKRTKTKDYLIINPWNDSIEPVLGPYNIRMNMTRSDEITPRRTRGKSSKCLQELHSKIYSKKKKKTNYKTLSILV